MREDLGSILSCVVIFKVSNIDTRTSQILRSSKYPGPDQKQPFKERGLDICDLPLANEKDLEAYQRLAVEIPTTHIISHLQRIEEARHAFDLTEGIISKPCQPPQ